MLGSIFQAKEEWGSAYDAQSAIFQWRHAIEARDRLNGDGPALVPSLYASLARAYQQSGRSADAAKGYLTSAEQYLQNGRADEASAVLYRVEQLEPGALDAPQRDRLENARKTLELERTKAGLVQLEPGSRRDALQRTLAADPALEGAEL